MTWHQAALSPWLSSPSSTSKTTDCRKTAGTLRRIRSRSRGMKTTSASTAQVSSSVATTLIVNPPGSQDETSASSVAVARER
jgi:hypothetical protein